MCGEEPLGSAIATYVTFLASGLPLAAALHGTKADWHTGFLMPWGCCLHVKQVSVWLPNTSGFEPAFQACIWYSASQMHTFVAPRSCLCATTAGHSCLLTYHINLRACIERHPPSSPPASLPFRANCPRQCSSCAMNCDTSVALATTLIVMSAPCMLSHCQALSAVIVRPSSCRHLGPGRNKHPVVAVAATIVWSIIMCRSCRDMAAIHSRRNGCYHCCKERSGPALP